MLKINYRNSGDGWAVDNVAGVNLFGFYLIGVMLNNVGRTGLVVCDLFIGIDKLDY